MKFYLHFLLALLLGDVAYADESKPPSSGALATMVLESRMYLLDPLPDEAEGAVSGWFYTLNAPNFYLTKDTFQANLQSNAEKFCAGGKWKPLTQKLRTHTLEFSFACYDQRALIYKRAAITQGMPKISLP